MCTGERERVRLTRALSHAPKRAEERAFGIARGAQIRTMLYHTENDRPTCVFEHDSTRKYFTRANTRRDGSYRIVSSFSLFFSLPLSSRAAREFSSSFRYVIRQTSKRFRVRATLQSGRLVLPSNFFLYEVVNFLFALSSKLGSNKRYQQFCLTILSLQIFYLYLLTMYFVVFCALCIIVGYSY